MLTLVRHGRTTANAQGRLQGRVDNPLDEVGRAQAAAIGRVLDPVDLLVTSPLDRAVSTATLAVPGAEPRIDPRWLELDYGELDGLPARDVPPETWGRWRDDLDFCPPGGETLVELGSRVREALEELVGAASTGHVVVVTHVSPIKAALAWALGVDDSVAWRSRLDQASITRIAVRDTSPVLVGFNDTAHLG